MKIEVRPKVFKAYAIQFTGTNAEDCLRFCRALENDGKRCSEGWLTERNIRESSGGFLWVNGRMTQAGDFIVKEQKDFVSYSKSEFNLKWEICPPAFKEENGTGRLRSTDKK